MTPKQEKFARLVAEGKNISEAYREVYSTEKMKPESVHREAYELSNHPKVSSMIDSLRKAATEKTLITLESHLEDLKALRNLAIKAEQYSAAITAEVARGKAAGIHVEKSEVKHELPEVVVRYID